jgi:glycosyltransferase involved in cell wall biosynthesis
MKIVHIITTINLGGAENHLFQLIRSQAGRGYQVEVVYLKGDHFWRDKYAEIGVATHCLGIWSYWSLFKFYNLRKIFAASEPDIIHAHMPPAELVARLALLGMKKTRFFISKHNDEPFAPVIKNLALANWTAKRATRIICISEAVKKYMLQWLLPESHFKLCRVYYGIDPRPFSDAEPAVDLLSDNLFTIGTISRLVPQKSLETLIDGFRIFHSAFPDSRLVIVGTGEEREKLISYSKELGIENAIIWTGQRMDIASLLKVFDVFALSSIYEGFGLVLLESMAAGTPIVASNVSAIPEVLGNGETGILFPARDAKMMAEAFIKLRDPDIRIKLSEAGKNRVREVFSLISMVDQTLELYQE